MKKKLNNIKIVSTGKYLPSKIVSNEDLEKVVETSDEWIFTRTGIKNRRYEEKLLTSDMAYMASLDAISKINFDKSLIDIIIVATFTGEIKSPSVANLVQAKLGLNEQDVMAFDVNAACTGFIYALNVASSLLASGNYRSALVIGAEKLTSVVDFEDRDTCVLFGDGAGAMIIEASKEKKPSYFYTSSKGDLEDIIVVNPLIHMEGRKVYHFASNILEKSILKVLEETGFTLDDINKIIPHQANLRIIESSSKKLGVELDKFYLNIEDYGNTSSASIPIAIDEYLSQNQALDGKQIVCVGFGGGFTWGAALLTI